MHRILTLAITVVSTSTVALADESIHSAEEILAFAPAAFAMTNCEKNAYTPEGRALYGDYLIMAWDENSEFGKKVHALFVDQNAQAQEIGVDAMCNSIVTDPRFSVYFEK